MIRRFSFALAGLLFAASSGSAATTAPRDLWVKAKCALCHGADGSSQTDAGRKVKAPDLRAAKTQAMTDEALARSISITHKGMPSFQKQLSAEKVGQLIAYIRGLVKAPETPSPRQRPR